MKQDDGGGNGISWTMCKKLAARFRRPHQYLTSHHSVLQARCPSCCPTNSVKAL